MTQAEAKAFFIDSLKQENSIFSGYEDINESTVSISFNGKDIEKVNIYVSFNPSENNSWLVTLGCFCLPNFADRYQKGIDVCNYLNATETVKYYIDKEGYATAYATLFFNSFGVSNELNPKQIISTAAVMALSADHVYTILQQALLQD